ncbi:serine hydrolase domain-containing protein [Streptomyces xanthophaeus]
MPDRTQQQRARVTSPPTRPSRTPLRRAAVAAGVTAAALTLIASLPAAAAGPRGPGDPVRQGLQRLVGDGGGKSPAALAAVTGRDGRIRHHTAGVADLRTGKKVPVDGQVRAGSNTKTFVATVVLQLVGEGKVELDAPIERYLPGLVRGEGIDGNAIRVRHLLQHTSGLPNYTDHIIEAVSGEGRHTYYQPRTLLDLALAHKAEFAPGAGWAYSNTNYVLAGLLIEKVTGRPLAEQITERVIDRIGLRHTYWPGVGDERIREAHPEGYRESKPGGPLENVTEIDMSWGWAAGQLISTPSDLNRFFSALVGGKLLGKAELDQMRTTVEVPAGGGTPPGIRFGLGVTSVPLSCGGLGWGHGGDTPGYHTRGAVTDDGRAATVAVTSDRLFAPGAASPQDLVDTALCS